MRITSLFKIATVICLAFVLVVSSEAQDDPFEDLTFQVVADPDGSLWLATFKGAIHIFPDGSSEVYNEASGLNADIVTQILIDPHGSKWFVHAGVIRAGQSVMFVADGISHLTQDGSIEIFTHDEGLPSGFVYGVAADVDGTIWFATNGGVAHLLDDGRFEVFTEDEGLPGLDVRHITVNELGQKWFATNAGLARMDVDGIIVTVYPSAPVATMSGRWSSGEVTSGEYGTVTVEFTVKESGDQVETEVSLTNFNGCGVSTTGTMTVSSPADILEGAFSWHGNEPAAGLEMELQGIFIAPTEAEGTFSVTRNDCEVVFEWAAIPIGG